MDGCLQSSSCCAPDVGFGLPGAVLCSPRQPLLSTQHACLLSCCCPQFWDGLTQNQVCADHVRGPWTSWQPLPSLNLPGAAPALVQVAHGRLGAGAAALGGKAGVGPASQDTRRPCWEGWVGMTWPLEQEASLALSGGRGAVLSACQEAVSVWSTWRCSLVRSSPRLAPHTALCRHPELGLRTDAAVVQRGVRGIGPSVHTWSLEHMRSEVETVEGRGPVCILPAGNQW